MARWKLTNKHYIHAEQYGQPTEWERQETNQQTGRMFRKTYKVPMYIDPDDPFCINKTVGYCVVARKGSEHAGDIVFEGPPTMDMEPLDPEAQAETDAEKHKWVDPINSLPLHIGEDAGQSILRTLENQIAVMGTAGVNHTLRGVSNPEIEQMKVMMAKQQEMINQLMGQVAQAAIQQPMPPNIDPPVEPDVPLVDIDPEALPKSAPIKVQLPKGHMVRRL